MKLNDDLLSLAAVRDAPIVGRVGSLLTCWLSGLHTTWLLRPPLGATAELRTIVHGALR